MALGRKNIFTKSFRVNDIPIPNIINASETGRRIVEKKFVCNTSRNIGNIAVTIITKLFGLSLIGRL
jgi:hypothetical protein